MDTDFVELQGSVDGVRWSMTVSLRDEGHYDLVWFITVTCLAARPQFLLHFLALSVEIVLLTQEQAVSAGCTGISASVSWSEWEKRGLQR